jgi:DNA-binding IclR family transcriptional regulator
LAGTEASLAVLADAVGAPRPRVNTALNTLMKRGEIQRSGKRGSYVYSAA